MNCQISTQIASYSHQQGMATLITDSIETKSIDVIERGYCNVGLDEVELSYVLEDAIKDNEQVLIELADLIVNSDNKAISTLKKLLTPYAEQAVEKAMAI